MTEPPQIPLEIVGSSGQTIATVYVASPLKLPLGHAMDLIARLAGEEEPPQAEAVTFADGTKAFAPDDDATAFDAKSEAWLQDQQQAQLERDNLRRRAEGYDLDGLRRWLVTLDPANPHMSVAYDIVTDRIDELEAFAPQSLRADTLVQRRLIAQARALEESYLADLELAGQGDEAARLRSQQTRSRLVELQEDIRDGVDRTEPKEGSQ